MASKKYTFYESDPILQDILDELIRNRELTPTIHRALLNGLGKDIKKTRLDLKKRINSMGKVEKLYKKLQNEKENKKNDLYKKYKTYRNQLIKNGMAYDTAQGISWISERATKDGHNNKSLLTEFEEQFNKEI